MRYDIYDEEPVREPFLVMKSKRLFPLLKNDSFVSLGEDTFSDKNELVLKVSSNGWQSTAVTLDREMFLLLKDVVNDPKVSGFFGGDV